MKTFTLGECKTQVLKLIDEYSNKGTLITSINNADYLNRMHSLINKVQIELADIVKLPAVQSFPLVVNKNLFTSAYDVKEYDTSTDIIYDSSDAAGSVYFAMAGGGTFELYYTLNGVLTLQETVTQTVGTYVEYRRLTTAKSLVRLVFTGDMPFTVMHPAAYTGVYSSAALIPAWSQFTKYTMPTDFMSLDKMDYLGGSKFNAYSYRWENDTTLVIPSNIGGVINVHYFKYPTAIADATADATTFDVEDKVAHIIPYKVAHLLTNNDQSKILCSTKCLELYEVELSRIVTPKVHDPVYIKDTFGMWGD